MSSEKFGIHKLESVESTGSGSGSKNSRGLLPRENILRRVGKRSAEFLSNVLYMPKKEWGQRSTSMETSESSDGEASPFVMNTVDYQTFMEFMDESPPETAEGQTPQMSRANRTDNDSKDINGN